MPQILSEIIGSDNEKLTFVDTQFRRALDASRRKRDRLYDNLSMYLGDQLPAAALEKASKEDRQLMVYNIAQRKVTGLVGSLLQNSFNITYMSIDNRNNKLIHGCQDMLMADQNSGNWDWAWMSFLKYGLIEESIMELTTSTRESPLGNLLFETTQPGAVIVDPNWRTGCSADMQECFKYVYMSPTAVLEMLPEASDELRAAILMMRRSGRDYTSNDGRASGGRELYNATNGGLRPKVGTEARFNEEPQTSTGGDLCVVQYTYLEPTKSVKTIDMSTGTELPETDDVQYKVQWMERNGIKPDYVRDITYPKKVLRVVTYIPELRPFMTKVVQDKPHEIQIQRQLYFPWSPERINGDTRGIVDIIKDMNEVLNKRENLLNNILENSANGAAAIDPDIVGNDPDMKNIIQSNWSNPKFKFWTQAGALATGRNYFAQLPKSPPPNEIFAQINHLWEGLDRVLPVNSASDGRSESSSESGILFSMKQNAIIVAQTTLVRGLMAILTELGDAYFRAAKSYYSNVERTFVLADGTAFQINKVIPLATGDVGIMNDISSLQNLRVLVKMGPDSPTARFTKRLTMMDLMKSIQPGTPLAVESQLALIETLDLDEDLQQRMKLAGAKNMEIAMAQADMVISQSQMAQSQAAQAQAQAQAPPAVPGAALGAPGATPGAPGEPAPQEGAESAIMKALAPLVKG